MADWNKSKNTDAWKGQVNRFCKYCKCWVADNKASQAGHEQGARHKKAVEDKLMEMKRQTAMNQKHQQDERHFLQRMEEAALRDYKHKDIQSNRDFTAKLYNNEASLIYYHFFIKPDLRLFSSKGFFSSKYTINNVSSFTGSS